MKKTNPYLGSNTEYAVYLDNVDGTNWSEMKKIIL